MNKLQQNKWLKEYSTNKGVPTTIRTSPSSSVTKAIDYLEKNNLLRGKNVIDLGCGIGRNALFLAKKGFNVAAVDFIQSALDKIIKKAKKIGLSEKITTINASIGNPLPFKENAFDLALDIVSTMSLNTKQMTTFEKELRRTLKKNGVFVSYILTSDDEYMLKYGNKEKGIYIAPESGIVEHCRSKDDIEKIYKNWEFLKLEKVEKDDFYYGKNYQRKLWWFILRNIKQ